MRYKLTFAIIIAVLLIGGGIWETVFVEKTFDKFLDKLDVIMEQEEYDLELVIDTADEWNQLILVAEVTAVVDFKCPYHLYDSYWPLHGLSDDVVRTPTDLRYGHRKARTQT